MKKHTFVIAAYGDSPYLESCIRSLMEQSVPSHVILCTSTPSGYIEALAAKYDIPVYVNTGEGGIANDWNFAYGMADSELVTLAHQDDMYHRDYTKEMLRAREKYPDMCLFTCASETVRDGKLTKPGKVEMVKRLLRLPLRVARLCSITAVKKAAVSLGNPIICPSCTYDRSMCGPAPFDPKYRFVLDWDFLYRLSEKQGRWVCCELPLIMYRVHADAATGQSILNHVRDREESEMFSRIFRNPSLADLFARLYKSSYEPYVSEMEDRGQI